MVFPHPPFWFTTAIVRIRPRPPSSRSVGPLLSRVEPLPTGRYQEPRSGEKLLVGVHPSWKHQIWGTTAGGAVAGSKLRACLAIARGVFRRQTGGRGHDSATAFPVFLDDERHILLGWLRPERHELLNNKAPRTVASRSGFEPVLFR